MTFHHWSESNRTSHHYYKENSWSKPNSQRE